MIELEPWVLDEGADEGGALLVRLVLSAKGLVARELPPDPARPLADVRLARGAVVADGALAAVSLLEDAVPFPPLLPDDAAERARSRRLLDLASCALRSGGNDTQNLQRVLGQLEHALASRPDGAPRDAFATGARLGLGGLAVVATHTLAARRRIDLDGLPELMRVACGIGRIPAVARACKLGSGRGIVDDLRPAMRDRAIALVARRVVPLAESIRLLSRIAWPRTLEEEFFARGAAELPRPVYPIDRAAGEAAIQQLETVLPELAGEHVLLSWLRDITTSSIDGYRMLLAAGTSAFYRLALEIYGGARTTAFDRDTTNSDLAEHLAKRVTASATLVDTAELDTDAFVALLERRLAERQPRMRLGIVRDPALSAKVICGRSRVRVREGARFGRAEAEGLYLHEIETHALTAQNGAAQRKLPMLATGGPRTTRAQEGLAVFSELRGGALSTPRLMRIVERVRLVAMAEEGASFLDLHRYLVARGLAPREAYLDVQRICRGGLVEGGAPFTKDASYLAGLVDVHAFLARALRFRSPLIGELLVAGRVSLDDSLALVWLHAQGLIEAPTYRPSWAADWDALLAYFAFASFLPEIESSREPPLPSEIEAFVALATAEAGTSGRAPVRYHPRDADRGA